MRKALQPIPAFLLAFCLVACDAGPSSEEPPAEEGSAAEDPRLEVEPGRGFFTEAQAVRITLEGGEPGWQIRFTLDGQPPGAELGERYTEPLRIDRNTVLRAAAFHEGEAMTPVSTQSYLFPAATLEQAELPARPPGLPAGWGAQEGAPIAADYAMDPRAFQSDGAREEALRALSELPTVSLALPVDALFDAETGIYANPLERGRDWERPVSMEWLGAGEEQGPEAFQVDAGLRVHGYYSRQPEKSPKHSLRLHFRKDYGPGVLEAELFPGAPVDRFDTLVLRAMVNDSVLMDGEKAQYLRDAWLRETERRMGLRTAHGRFVHLYLSGLYWGLYELTERLDEDFGAAYWGGDPEDYDVVLHAGANAGDLDAWDETLALAQTGLESREAYEALAERVDLVAFVDHWLLGQFAARTDWPAANWTAIRRRDPGGRWRFPGWDAEASLLEIDLDRSGSAEDGTPAQLYSRLRRNTEFQLLFADRVQKHMGEGGLLYVEPGTEAWDPARPSANAPAARYAALADGIEGAVLLESARWGDWLRPEDLPFGRDRDWIPARDFVLGSFFPRRGAVLLEQLQARELYPAVAAPRLRVDGDEMVVEAPEGRIKCRRDGGDPRVPWDNAVAPEAEDLVSGARIPLAGTDYVHLRCRARSERAWSALSEQRHGAAPLRLSELMYHPAKDGAAEFVELVNAGEQALDLGGFRLSGGIDFRFPEPSPLPPGARAVLVADPAAFGRAYPEVSIAGRYVGRLSNGGERISLLSPEGGLIEAVEYADAAPWPEAADGEEASLERAAALHAPIPVEAAGEAANWRASDEIGGTPGR